MVKKTEIKRSNLFKLKDLSEKEIKNLEVLELISKKGVISRTDISKITGINIVSISNYIKDYIDRKLVDEKGLDVSSGGRKPELVELAVKENYVIGIAVDREAATLTLTDLNINVVENVRSALLKSTVKEISATLAALIKEVISKAGISENRVKSISIGSADDNLASVAKILEKHFSIPVFFSDESLAAAFGENRLNKDASAGSMLYMHSDLGKGVMIENHTCEIADDSSEKSKYLKPWPVMLGMAAMANKEVSKGVGTRMVELASGKVENITEDVVIKAAGEKDEVASNIIYSAGINLGLRTAYLVNLFSPETVVIGGGAQKAGEPILDTVRKMVARLALTKFSKTVRIIPGALEDGAVNLGAASLAVREIFLKA